MENTCIICFDTMDMVEFDDERDSTQTCIKLDCGHAYHTRCIVQCLSSTNHKCPNCNKSKGPEHQLTKDGLVKKLIDELKRDSEVKEITKEYKEIRNEFKETKQQLKKDINEFVERRKKELAYDEKRKYFISCVSKIKTVARNIAKENGPMYLGIFKLDGYHSNRWNGTYFEKLFFGAAEARRNTRLKYGYHYARL
jgi:hypothetical protein